MSLVLSVDGERWRRHLRATVASMPGLVPVAKGNGYGLGLGRLARRTQWLTEQVDPRVDTLAVGTYDELGEIADRCHSDLLVLTPWRPFGAALESLALPEPLQRRLVHTLGRVEDVAALLEARPHARYVLERETSMHRHGLPARDLWAVARTLPGGARGLAGVALHLPLTGSGLPEARRLVNDVAGADLPDVPGARTVWVSHLTAAELATLAGEYPDFTFRPRVGTGLWLGDRGALRVSATVLDVHPVQRGDAFGYRGRTAPRDGHLLVVSGGTAHGIGLEAPTGDLGLRSRAVTLAKGGLDAVGFVRSPFEVDGKQRLFAEPPHMQVSMLFLPAGSHVPQVGSRVDVRVRFTTTQVDRVEID